MDPLYQRAGGDNVLDMTRSSGMRPDERGLRWGLGVEGKPGRPAVCGRKRVAGRGWAATGEGDVA